MRHYLEIYTDCEKRDHDGNYLNERWCEFATLHALTEFVVNICDAISIDFNSGTPEGKSISSIPRWRTQTPPVDR